MRGTATALGAAVYISMRAALAGEPEGDPDAPAGWKLPADGMVAFSYAMAPGVEGCSQRDEASVRFLLKGVMRVEPFVPAGKAAPITLLVRVARARPGAVRATFELRDEAGASLGASYVEDPTCDGAHLKLAASIALLLVPAEAGEAEAGAGGPGGEAPCPEACAGAAAEKAGADSTKPDGVSRLTTGAAAGSGAAEIAPAGPLRVCKVRLSGYCFPVDIYSFSFAVGGSLSLGFTADPGAGAWANAEVRPIEAFSLALEFRGLFPARVVAAEPTFPNKPSGTPKEPLVSNATAMLVPCLRYWWLMGCGVVHFGFSIAETPAELTGWPVVGAGPRVGLDIPFTELFFARVQGDVLFNFTDTGLDLIDQNLTWRQNIVSGFIGIGVGVSLR